MKKEIFFCLLSITSIATYAVPINHFHDNRSHSHPLPIEKVSHKHDNGAIGSIKNNALIELDDMQFIAIPASAFTGQNSNRKSLNNKKNGYTGNSTGTTRYFKNKLFAPVNIPHKAVVTLLYCRGSSVSHARTVFRLRRNEPQQANIEIANVKTSLDDGGFESMTSRIRSNNKIDNYRYNYYLVAEHLSREGYIPSCELNNTGCSVNTCSIGYIIPFKQPVFQ